MIEITGYTKRGGPLTKRISLKEDGTLCSDGSQCVMPSGEAERIRLNDLHAFGRLLTTMTPADAIGLGTLRRDLPDKVEITTKIRLEALNGEAVPHLIARTGEFIVYRPRQPTVVLIDVDTKGMPAAVKARVDAKGGFWPALVSVLPDGVLLSEIVLPFDLEEFEGATVGAVIADPDRFVGATLSDPLEGVSYGRCKAKIMRRASGAVWINSFAHGRTVYELKLSAHAIEAIVFDTPNDQLVAVFVRLTLAGWLAADEYQRLRDEVAQRTSINRRTIDQTLKDARTVQKQDQAREDATRREAERVDTRPQLPVPVDDDPWLPQMRNLFEVLSQPTQAIPASRDIDGERSRLKMTTIPEMHLLQPTGDTAE